MGSESKPISLWARNVQLSLFSLVASIVPLILTGDLTLIQRHGFFFGYTAMTWLCVLMNALGGLLVGMVIKHADTKDKDVAMGGSILLITLASVAMFHFELTVLFAFGLISVLNGILLYGERAFCLNFRSDTT